MVEHAGFRRDGRGGHQRRDRAQQVELGPQGAALEGQGARQMGELAGELGPPGVRALSPRVDICV